MKQLLRSDIKGPAIYAGIRDDFRKRIIQLKKPRRIHVGDKVTLVFENRQTLIFQIEEMLRAERIADADKIADEIEVYTALMPTDDSLSATLFIELPPDADARVELDQLIGLDEHLLLHIGDHAIRASFEEGRGSAERISAVQYTRFPLSQEARVALLQAGTPVTLEIDHPQYQHLTSCSDATRASLAADYA